MLLYVFELEKVSTFVSWSIAIKLFRVSKYSIFSGIHKPGCLYYVNLGNRPKIMEFVCAYGVGTLTVMLFWCSDITFDKICN